jgi:hypothetical protein
MAVLAEKTDVDVVIGARVKLLGREIHRRPLRHYLGRLFATMTSLVLGIAVYDTQCGAKIFRVNRATRDTFARPFRSTWIFDVEVLARYVAITGSAAGVYELPLRMWRDVPGSKMRWRAAVRAAWDLGVISWLRMRGQL